MHLVSQSPADTQAIAAKLAQRLHSALPRATATVVALYGDLGAGKTTFTQGFAEALGITQQPKSPTFLLAKEYAIPQTPYSLWHLDCYRLQGHRDLVTLDLHRIFENPNNIVLVEWPEHIGAGLPRDTIEVRFTHEGPTSRGITINENP